MATNSVSFRKVRGQKPVAVSKVDTGAGIQSVLDRIVRVIDLPPRSPAYLFISPDGAAFVLHEGHQALQVWNREHWGWFVGVYGKPAAEFGMLAPTLEGLSEDIAQHFTDLAA